MKAHGRRSAFGQVLQVQPVLCSALGLLHLPQASEGANPHRDAQQFALNRVVGELGEAGYALRALNDVEPAEHGHGRDIPAPADDSEVGLWAEGSVLGSGQSRLQLSQGFTQALQVAGVRVGDDVQTLGAADESVRSYGDTTDHDEINALLMQRLEQRTKVELAQRTLAAPWIALSCLQSACTLAKRSLIGARRSASRRIARARFSSPMSPLSALASMGSILTALLISLAIAPQAKATYDPVGSGQTKLTIDKGFSSFLKRNGITLTASAGAKRKGSSVTLPVPSGNLDPTLGMGEIDNEGTIAFQGAKGKVPLRKITVKTKNSTLIAKVGGGQLKVATSAKRSSARSGFGTKYTAKALKLTAKAATRLNKKLRPKAPFAQGQVIGSLATDAQPKLITILPQNKASIALDPAFASKMDGLFVSINPIFPAEHPGAFTFPVIGGGQIAPNGSEGTLRTGGQIEFLQLAAGQVFWNELWLDLASRSDSAEVDIEPIPAFPGKLGRVGVLDLGQASVSSDPKARTISVSNAPLTLTADSAKHFNEAFAEGKAAFSAGEAFGVLSFVAQAQ